MNVLTFKERKSKGLKISMVTCYDYTSARIANTTSVDTLLVGDSLAMTMYGERSTLPATIEVMAQHTEAVVRGAPDKFIVGDMPFLSYRLSLSENVKAAGHLMRAGAHAVKLEGVRGNGDLVQHLVESGIPVMGHLGLTPQSVNQFGGFRVQGREKSQAESIIEGAKELERRGCFAVVLECVPSALAREVTQALEIPTIGIGAGPDTDGQVLVWQDLLGLNEEFKPKFVRRYLNGADIVREALNRFAADVNDKSFPSPQESYE